MKKYSWLVALIAIFALAFVGFISCDDGDPSTNDDDDIIDDNITPSGPCLSCGAEPCSFSNIWECLANEADFVPGSGGSGGSFIGNIFIDGEFPSSEIGEVFLFSWTDDNGRPTAVGEITVFDNDPDFGNTMLGSLAGGMIGMFFENYIDVSDADMIIFNIMTGINPNWTGGILFFYNEDDPTRPFQAQEWDAFGGAGGTGRLTYGFDAFDILNSPGSGAPDFTKLVGFAFKTSAILGVNRIRVAETVPLFTAKTCPGAGCDVHPITIGTLPLSGQRQVALPADHVKLRAAPAGSYVVIYFDVNMGVNGGTSTL